MRELSLHLLLYSSAHEGFQAQAQRATDFDDNDETLLQSLQQDGLFLLLVAGVAYYVLFTH